MRNSAFGLGEMDVLHVLSLGLRLSPDSEIINSLIRKGFANIQDGAAVITDEGRNTLYDEFDAILKSLPEWLESAEYKRRHGGAR